MGLSSTATKGPFCPWPSSASSSSSSSRFLYSASLKALKRREICTIRNAHSTISNITMLSRFSRLHHSSYDVGTSPVNKRDYMPMEDTSPVKKVTCYQDKSRFEGKSSSREIFYCQKVDFERQQGSGNYSGVPDWEFGHDNSYGTNFSRTSNLGGQSLSRNRMEWKNQGDGLRAEVSAYYKNESLKDGSSYSSAVVGYKQSSSQTSKLDGHAQVVTEPKGIGYGNAAVNHVNGQTLVDRSYKTIDSTLLHKNLEEHSKKIDDKTPKKDEPLNDKKAQKKSKSDFLKRLDNIYTKVLVVDNIAAAKEVVTMLTCQYRDWVHACDTEVAKIDVKQETPINHGEVICFSIYSGPKANFGNGKSCIWVDVLDGGGSNLLSEFAPFFENPAIKKVWHNYSFDNHIIENYGLKLSGFHADTMHMARLWDSSRRTEGGYALEALTGDQRVMSEPELQHHNDLIGKISMEKIFGRKKLRKDGSEGKTVVIPPVEELQREVRKSWICYSALDAISTLELYESLKCKLSKMPWKLDKKPQEGKTMFDFYQEYWRPFGEILVKMETDGMLVDRPYLAEIEKVAKAEQEVAANRFRNWASKYCLDAKYMNVGSDAQLRQLLFGGTTNSKDPNESLPCEKIIKVPNTEGVIEEGKKTPTKYRNIKLHCIDVKFPVEIYTASGWPSVSGDALKSLAAKISAQYDFADEDPDLFLDDDAGDAADTMTDGACNAKNDSEKSFLNFRTLQERREAFHAIASLCKVCSIDSLISNFILPLQGSNVSGKNGRVHCSLNINTETGRLSARRPNLQNQPALEKDRYKIRQAFIAAPGNSLIVADYGQLELRILAHLANCKSMLDAFKAGGDFHSRTAMNMYPHIREAIETKQVLLEWHPQPGETKPPVPLLKDAFASERRKAKMLNFSIAYGKTPQGLARDWKVSVEEAKHTVKLWYKERQEVLTWQEDRKKEACEHSKVHTLLGRARRFPSIKSVTRAYKNHIERAAINTPVQGSAADVAMCAMLEISKNARLKELGWRLLLQVHDEVILEGPSKSAEVAKAIVVECMSKPFNGENILSVDLNVDAKCAQNWYAGK
ncbi:hypothetical protein ACOSQ2_030782 [Xanthoceras sorbifolium]